MTTKTILKIVAATIFACLAIEVLAGLLFLASGLYNIAADQPHWALAHWILKTGEIRSVQLRGKTDKAPGLRDKSLIQTGARLYLHNCQPCHGGPGIAQEQVGRGITPNPPMLAEAADKWTDSQLFWIVSHGLKMSGMPAFDAALSDKERWGLVAFLRRMPFLSPGEYQQFTKAADQHSPLENVNWLPTDDYGFAQLDKHSDAARGAKLLRRYGCATCHVIGGIGAGVAGPPLADLAERQYIAGILVNVPSKLSGWIEHPKLWKPGTAMPDLGVKPDEAVDMAAYLYAGGLQHRMDVLRRLARQQQ